MAACYHPGRNIVDDDADILVCPVNCVGVMGKGVAKDFARRWPEILRDYRRDCANALIRPGHVICLPLPDGRLWAAFPTKLHWRNPSRLEWIADGLDHFGRWLERHPASIAVPMLGCGNGGLDWREVEPIVLQHLGGFDLRIYGERTV